MRRLIYTRIFAVCRRAAHVAVVGLVLGAVFVLGGGSSLKIQGGKSVTKLRFDTADATYCEIWASSNLQDWELAGMVLGTGSEQVWDDSRMPGDSHRFYRVATKPVAESADADGDGFDDVYELVHGMNPLVASGIKVASISVANTQLAAGAIATPPHQTQVVLTVVPPGAFPVLVWLEGGCGHGTGTTNLPIAGIVSQVGPAMLSGYGQTFVAGGDHPSTQPMLVTASAAGEVLLLLTSSNEAGERCSVHAQAGTVRIGGPSQATSPEITFEPGTLEVNFPRSLIGGDYSSAVVTRTFNGEPLAGHDVLIFVSAVQINGQALAFAEQTPLELDVYAVIDSALQRQAAGLDGSVRASVFVKDVEGLDLVEVKALDLQVFTPNLP